MVTEGQAQVIAEQVLRPLLDAYGFSGVAVHAGYDHDGDESFFVEAYLAEDAAPVDGYTSAAVIGALREALSAKDDRRFPYINFKRPSEDLMPSELPA